MKYLYIEIMLIAIRLFDLLPNFLLKCIFSANSAHFTKNNIELNINGNQSKKILFWMDYSNAIGDFFIILKSIIKYDQLGKTYSVLVHKKFEGIIESLRLKNIEIIYKENSLGKHYLKENIDLVSAIKKIETEFKEKKLIFDKIYYFNGILLSDAITAIKEISYNKLIMIDPKIFLRGNNSKFIDRNFIKLSLHYLLHRKQLRINTILTGNYKKYSLTNIIEKVLNIENEKYTSYNYPTEHYSIISAGASNATKVLKQENLLKVIANIPLTEKRIFVGSDFDKKFIGQIINDNVNNFELKFNLELSELLEIIKNSSIVVSYDTGLFHMANFLNKKTYLIVNEKDFAYKYMRNYWLGNEKINNQRIVLKNSLFNK